MDALTALVTAGYYNGHGRLIRQIVDYVASRKDALFPSELIPNKDIDTYSGVLWSVLVVMFGEYGTSPRFGWITDTKRCAAALETALMDFDDTEG